MSVPYASMRRAGSALGCAIGTLLLASCEFNHPPAPAPQRHAAASATVEAKPVQPPKRREQAQVAIARPRPSSEATKNPDGDAPTVGAVGLEESRVRALFGEPESEVDDAPAKRLRYRSGPCSMEFALYPDVDTRAYRTLTLEVSSDDGTAKGKRLCIAELKSRIAAK